MKKFVDTKVTDKPAITPDIKISTLLDAYPELEKLLIELAPAFRKLKNPVLRKTVAKVANLRQAAEIGKVSLGHIINKLRAAAGQKAWDEKVSQNEFNRFDTPSWFESTKIMKSLDARPILETGGHPVNRVIHELNHLNPGQIYELITPFIPSPLIDMAQNKGFKTWSKDEAADLVKTYFCK